VRDIVPETAALQADIVGGDIFPGPFQILILRIRKTPELTDVLTRFRAVATRRGLRPFEEITPEQWTFHMSVAYCRRLGLEPWNRVANWWRSLDVPIASARINALELVAFDHGRESSVGVFQIPLTSR
jgi:hypothetical protein